MCRVRQAADGTHLGTRCEIKNVNSMRFIAQAVEYEARRQIEIIEGGGTIKQETRLYDSKLGETRSMRSKEEAHDYRYFPDPDLLPLELGQGMGGRDRASLPELPDEKKARFMSAYGLSAYDASVLVAERELADYFEALAQGCRRQGGRQLAEQRNPRPSEQRRAVDHRLSGFRICQQCDPGDDFGRHHLRQDRQGSARHRVERGRRPRSFWSRRAGLRQVTDTSAIEKAIEDVIAANPDKVEEVKAKPKLAGWFVGQVMKQTGGKANPTDGQRRLKIATQICPTRGDLHNLQVVDRVAPDFAGKPSVNGRSLKTSIK